MSEISPFINGSSEELSVISECDPRSLLFAGLSEAWADEVYFFRSKKLKLESELD